EAVGDTLEELWISYNQIEKLKGIGGMKKLKVLYMSNNLVKEWVEFQKLAELQTLHELVFTGNPLHDKFLEDNGGSQDNWQAEVQKRLKPLKKLDGSHIIREAENTE
ncbi:unnamed protein product, partial [Rotaria magnacalcarata]